MRKEAAKALKDGDFLDAARFVKALKAAVGNKEGVMVVFGDVTCAWSSLSTLARRVTELDPLDSSLFALAVSCVPFHPEWQPH